MHDYIQVVKNKIILSFSFLILSISFLNSFSYQRALFKFSTGGLLGVFQDYLTSGLSNKKYGLDINLFVDQGSSYKNENNSNSGKETSFNSYSGSDIDSNDQSVQYKQKKIFFEDIIGLDEQLKDIKEVVEFVKNPSKFKALGAKMPRGILLEGPPGNGKTLIARAIASESGCNFFYESGSSFIELYVGVGAKKLRKLFNKANSNAPAVIFIDEIDAIGAVNRGVGANEEYRQTLNELLCLMDGFKRNDNVIVLAATNNSYALDPALKRPGRFTRIIEIPKPNSKARKQILQYYINKLPKFDYQNFDLDYFVKETINFSCAQLENLINEAAIFAVRSDSTYVGKEHFDYALIKSF